jgi:hypothetical protein
MRKLPLFVVAVIFMSGSLGCARALRSFLFSLSVLFLTLWEMLNPNFGWDKDSLDSGVFVVFLSPSRQISGLYLE